MPTLDLMMSLTPHMFAALKGELPDLLPVDLALFAISLGFFVLPSDPRSKKPYIRDWTNAATSDPEIARSWWSHWPDAMVGVVTGRKAGFFVLDIDVEDGEDAFQKLQDLETEVGMIPREGLMVQTPSGGLHIYMALPPDTDIKNSASVLGAGIDIRANGGYVVFPGSKRADGRIYQLITKGA